MSPRRDSFAVALLVSIPLAAATGAVEAHGLRIAFQFVDANARSALWVGLAAEVTTFLAGTVAVLALGYRLGGGPTPNREFRPLGTALFAGGLVGFSVGVLLPLLVVPSVFPGLAAGLLRLGVTIAIRTVQFTLAGLAGFAAATLLGGRGNATDAASGVRS